MNSTKIAHKRNTLRKLEDYRNCYFGKKFAPEDQTLIHEEIMLLRTRTGYEIPKYILDIIKSYLLMNYIKEYSFTTYNMLINNIDTEQLPEFIDVNVSGYIPNYPEPYTSFYESITKYENNRHYSCLMCLKNTRYGPNYDAATTDKYMVGVNKMIGRDNLKYKCVRPVGHTGNCHHKFNSLFKKNDITNKLISSIDLAIYTSPGNDDYVYKNRCSRLYKNVLSSDQEKKIRNKNEKKKCALPLKDASTPILLAQAYLDWITYIVNITDIKKHLNITEHTNSLILEMTDRNKEHLISVYLNRTIFNPIDGCSICAITRNVITLNDVSDPTRDNRIHISDNDIQLGHNYPRTDEYVSIRGENLLPMSRRGNLVIGEKVFTQDLWISELKQIVNPYNI